MMVMAREASVQLTYQNALLLYQFFYPPLVELDFTNNPISYISPSVRWIFGLVLQIISIVLSAKSTFSPINDYKILSGFKNDKPVRLINYILLMVQVILHLIFAAGIVYLLKVNQYINLKSYIILALILRYYTKCNVFHLYFSFGVDKKL